MVRFIPCLLAFALALPSPARAQDRKAQYRQLTLTDGREITVEVLATESIGLLLRSPQGHSIVSFEVLVDMIPADKAAYDAQSNWNIYIGAPLEHRELLAEAFGWLQGVNVHFAGEQAPGMSASQASAAADCSADFNCMLDATLDATGWMFVVSVTPTDSGDLQLFAGLNTGDTRIKSQIPDTRDGRWQLVHEAIMIEIASDGPPKAPKGEKQARNTRGGGRLGDADLISASFVPIPGYPSFKQGDAGGGMIALAVAVPTSVALVGAAGHGGQTAAETAIVAGIGTYAATIIANQIGGKISQGK
jgi:hypothetical protein